jgi:hypothetical protein
VGRRRRLAGVGPGLGHRRRLAAADSKLISFGSVLPSFFRVRVGGCGNQHLGRCVGEMDIGSEALVLMLGC